MSEIPGAGERRERKRRHRRRQWTVLGVIAGCWLLVGGVFLWGDWPGGDEDASGSPYAGGVWEEIGPAPLAERLGAGRVWAGDRLVVWSGGGPEVASPGSVSDYFTDGAVWRPGGDWTAMAPPPDELALPPGGFAVWTGREVIFGPVVPASAGDREPLGGDAGDGDGGGSLLLAYEPAGDSWRVVPVAGARLAAAATLDERRYRAVMVGGRLLVAVPWLQEDGTAQGGGLVAIDAARGDARVLEPEPFGEPGGYVALTVAGDRLVAMTSPGDPLWLYDPAPDGAGWTRAGLPPHPENFSFYRLVGAGEAVLLLDDREPYAYDLAAGTWTPIAAPPPARGRQAGRHFVWTGDAVLAPGRVYDPAADRWARTEPLPLEPEDVLNDPYVTWTGEALVVFGGVLHSCPADEDCDIAADEPQTLSGWLYLS